MPLRDPDCCAGGDWDMEEKILPVSHHYFLSIAALRAEWMKGSVPGSTAREIPGSCKGSAAGIGTSCTSLDAAGYAGHLQRLAEDTGAQGDWWPSGKQLGVGRTVRISRGRTVGTPRISSISLTSANVLFSCCTAQLAIDHQMGTDLHMRVSNTQQFVYACVSFLANTILIFLLLVNLDVIYHNLASGSQKIELFCDRWQPKHRQGKWLLGAQCLNPEGRNIVSPHLPTDTHSNF